jgi:glucan phosphoethanolaminetransferase (alkaline phosphatase superfamily)
MNDQTEKWLTFAIWLGLVIGLAFTSMFAFNMVKHSREIDTLVAGIQDDTELNAIDFIAPVVYSVLAMLILLAWWRLADLSRDILVAMAGGASPIAAMLFYPAETEVEGEDGSQTELDSQLAFNSTPSSILHSIGYAWGLIIAVPELINLLTKLLE